MQAAKKKFRIYPSSKLEHLGENQSKKLYAWLLGPYSYREVRRKLKAELGVSTSLPAISKFYRRHVLQHQIALRQQSIKKALGYTSETDKSKAAFDAFEQKAVEACYDPSTNPRDLKVYLELLLRWQEQKIREQANEVKVAPVGNT